MKKILFYYLYYIPQGMGRVVFRLEGESENISTPPLQPQELTALAAVLAQKNISYDKVRHVFVSTDTNDIPKLDFEGLA